MQRHYAPLSVELALYELRHCAAKLLTRDEARRNWVKVKNPKAPRTIGGEAAQQGRGPPDRGKYCEAAGASAEAER